MQYGDGDPITPINRSLKTARKTFAPLRKTVTDTRLPVDLRLRLWRSTVISTLRRGCEPWQLTEGAQKSINGVVPEMLAKITCRPIVDEATHQTYPVMETPIGD